MSFPFSAGSTSVTAFAAPVEAGIMFCAAARPPRKSFFAQAVNGRLSVSRGMNRGHEPFGNAKVFIEYFGNGG